MAEQGTVKADLTAAEIEVFADAFMANCQRAFRMHLLPGLLKFGTATKALLDQVEAEQRRLGPVDTGSTRAADAAFDRLVKGGRQMDYGRRVRSWRERWGRGRC